MKKKIVSCILSCALIVTSCGQVFAMSNSKVQLPKENTAISNEFSNNGSFEKLPEITDAELDRALEKAIMAQVEKVEDKEEAKLLEEELRMYLLEDGSSVAGEIRTLGLIDDIKDKLPNIKIRNKKVAAAINTIIDGTLIALGVGTLGVALKKYGAKQLARMFTRTLKRKVLGKVCIALGISVPYVTSYIMYIVDPAAKLADVLDSRDDDRNNGYLDVIWSKH